MDAPNETQRDGLPGILNKRLWHYCMWIFTMPLRRKIPRAVLDPNGFYRMVLYILMAYIADLEEQWMIAALGKGSCPHCLARTNDLGATTACEKRTSSSILADIEKCEEKRGKGADPWHFALEAKKYGLCGVDQPFWVGLPFVDICRILSQDLLHGYHKFFFDHPFKWNTATIGEKEMDQRMVSQPNRVGARNFPKGG